MVIVITKMFIVRYKRRCIADPLNAKSMHESEMPIISALPIELISNGGIDLPGEPLSEPSGCLAVNDALRSFNVVRVLQDEYY